jgi:soluble lytic murein transglycosylase-like protein
MRAMLFLLLCLLSLPALATPPVASPTQLCEAAVVNAEHDAHLPARMMGAISLVESGRPDPSTGTMRPWPWTINAEGQDAFFASKQEAVDAVRALQARGIRSIDIGCMQVNLMYHPDAFVSLEFAFDPDTNARYAARFLTELHRAGREWPAAIAAYHSETPWRGARYQQLVLARLGWPVPLLGGRAYGDFVLPTSHYRDFQPKDAVYGAFAKAIDAVSTPLTRR